MVHETVLGRPRWTDPERRDSINLAASTRMKREWFRDWFRPKTAWGAQNAALRPLQLARSAIQSLIESRMEDFFSGVAVQPGWALEVAMYGRSVDDAQPTVICSSPNSRCRSNASNIIAQEQIIVDDRGIGIEFYHDPVIFYSGKGPISAPDYGRLYDAHYMTPSNGLHPPFMIEVCGNTCTVGGSIMVNGQTYFLTIAHAFDFDVDPSSSAFHVLSTDGQTRIPDAGVLWEKRPSATRLGRDDYDWALCSIDPAASRFNSVLGYQPFVPYPIRIASEMNSGTPVRIRTARRGEINAKITSICSLVALPGSRTFQQMCSLATETPLGIGDSGSWVVDACTHDVYGIVVAGKPSTVQAYFLPIKEVLDDISNHLDAEVGLCPISKSSHDKSPSREASAYSNFAYPSVLRTSSPLSGNWLSEIIISTWCLCISLLTLALLLTSLVTGYLLHPRISQTLHLATNDSNGSKAVWVFDSVASSDGPLANCYNSAAFFSLSSDSDQGIDIYDSYDQQDNFSKSYSHTAWQLNNNSIWNAAVKVVAPDIGWPFTSLVNFSATHNFNYHIYSNTLMHNTSWCAVNMIDFAEFPYAGRQTAGDRQAIHYRRRALDIIWSCALTIVLCVWTPLKLNISAPTADGKHVLRKLRWSITGFLAPEVVMFAAWQQRQDANEIMKVYNRACGLATDKTDKPSWVRTLLSPQLLITQLRALVSGPGLQQRPSASEKHYPPRTVGSDGELEAAGEKSGPQKKPWTMAQGFYVQMGGLVVDIPATLSSENLKSPERRTLTAQAIRYLSISTAGLEKLPDISTRYLDDRSKSDGLLKVITITQAVLLLSIIAARIRSSLPVSLLEATTATHVICTLFVFLLWWEKPDIITPTIVKDEGLLSLDALKRMFEEPVGVDQDGLSFVEGDIIESRNACFPQQSLPTDATVRLPRDLNRRFEGTDFSVGVSETISRSLGLWRARVRATHKPFLDLAGSQRRSLAWRAWQQIQHLPLKQKRDMVFQSLVEYSPMLPRVSTFGVALMLALAMIGTNAFTLWITGTYPPLPSLDRQIWMIFTTIICATPLAALLLATANGLFTQRARKARKYWRHRPAALLALIYVSSKVALMIEAVVSLRSVPPEIYMTANWSELLPHF